MTQTDPQTQLTLADYVAVLGRRKWVIMQLTAIAAIVAFVFSTLQDKVFQASSEVFLSRQSVSSMLTGISSPDLFGDAGRFAETQAGLGRTLEVARRAVAQARVPGHTATDLLDHSTVRPKSNADLLRFTVDDHDPAAATRLANSYARAFTAYRADLDTAQLSEARHELEGRIATLRRSGQTGGTVYKELVDSAQQLRTMELLQTPNVVVREAIEAEQVAPTPVRYAALGAFLGVILGVALAFLWEALDRRVRTEEEIERRLGVPLLARLPAPSRQVEHERRLSMVDEPHDVYAEAMRRLRTNLEFANIDRAARLIMVTSATEREGKSTTSANLAVALARSGRNVTVVDLDLRQPAIASYFGLDGRPGITDVVLGNVALEDALFPMRLPVPGSGMHATPVSSVKAYGRMRVLTTGPLPASPGEFVGTHALARVLERLRTDDNYVIVDVPPALAVGDAMTLSSRVDAIVAVVRLGFVDRRTLTDFARELGASPAHKLGLVVTGAKLGTGHGYGYGKARPVSPLPPPREPTAARSDTAPAAARR